METDVGAKPDERALGACRTNNLEQLDEAISDLAKEATQLGKKPTQYVAEVLNTIRDGTGFGCLHLAVIHGNYEIIDHLLDQEGLEIDEPDRTNQDTPLHKAVAYINALEKYDWESQGNPFAEILLDAGCDPRIRNAQNRKPAELVHGDNKELIMMFQKAEFQMQAGGDVVQEDDDGPTGSASDSD